MTALFIQNMGGATVLLFLLVAVFYFFLWIYCLIDVIRSDFKDQNMKLIWVVVLLFAHLIGPIAYLVLRNGSKLN